MKFDTSDWPTKLLTTANAGLLHVFGRKCPKRAGKKIPKFPKEDTYITKDMYYTPIARLN